VAYGCQAADVTENGLLWYQINDEVHLYDYVGSESELILPDSINGKPVTHIEKSAFASQSTLIKVVISRSVHTIRYGAFQDNKKLEQVYIPNSVEVIADNGQLFINCTRATIYVEANAKPAGWAEFWLPLQDSSGTGSFSHSRRIRLPEHLFCPDL
jgi:hypothetical protein